MEVNKHLNEHNFKSLCKNQLFHNTFEGTHSSMCTYYTVMVYLPVCDPTNDKVLLQYYKLWVL